MKINKNLLTRSSLQEVIKPLLYSSCLRPSFRVGGYDHIRVQGLCFAHSSVFLHVKTGLCQSFLAFANSLSRKNRQEKQSKLKNKPYMNIINQYQHEYKQSINVSVGFDLQPLQSSLSKIKKKKKIIIYGTSVSCT